MSENASDAVGLERASVSGLDDGRTRLFEGEPKTLAGTLEAGEEVPAHQHPDRDVLFHVLSGEVDLRLNDETVSLSAGEIARFDGEQDISPRAETDAEVLVVLAPSA